jgi:hypothetical protein
MNIEGGKKGGLSAAVVEALEEWLKKHKGAIERGGMGAH